MLMSRSLPGLKRRQALAVVCLAVFVTGSQAEERILWKDQPVVISLVPDTERIVVFPAAVEKISVPAALSSTVRTQILDKRVFLLTGSEFSNSRIKVVAGGKLYLIDLVGRQDGRTDIAYLMDPVVRDAPRTERSATDRHALRDSQVPPEVALVRHAAQTLYAPERLIPVHGRSVFQTATKERVLNFPLFRQQDFRYRLLAEWSGFGLYVTAIALSNRESIRVDLDPRAIRGHWRARALQHPWVGRQGALTDHTTVYLISEQPFANTLPSSLSGGGAS